MAEKRGVKAWRVAYRVSRACAAAQRVMCLSAGQRRAARRRRNSGDREMNIIMKARNVWHENIEKEKISTK